MVPETKTDAGKDTGSAIDTRQAIATKLLLNKVIQRYSHSHR
jgi:hypothetical protein